MASINLLTLSLFLFLSLLANTSAVPASSVAGALKSLSNAGFNSMALTLEIGNRTVLPTNTLTIFAPPDTAFNKSGQPPLFLLHFHFSPLFISPKTLQIGSKIPTFFSNHSLIVTSSPGSGEFAFNGVKINGSALFDDGSLVVFGTEGFFDPNFVSVVNASKDKGFICGGGRGSREVKYKLGEASEVLKIDGFSIMAAFLDLQVGEFSNNTPMTIFAPSDNTLKGSVGNFTRSRSVFLRHLVPCRISRSDLENFDGGVVLPTFLEGFSLGFNKSSSVFMIGGVKVTAVDMYRNDWIVVHGIQKSFVEEDRAQDRTDVHMSSSNKITLGHLLFSVIVVLYWHVYALIW